MPVSWGHDWIRRRAGHPEGASALPVSVGVFGTSVYGGYSGAAQGVLLTGLPGTFLPDGLQRLNALKNYLAALVNGVTAVVFIAVTEVDWAVAGVIGPGSVIGGFIGARLGRRLPPGVLRGLIVTIGVIASVAVTV